MELDYFRDRLDAQGADLAAWPADERAAAQALLAGCEPARAALAAARRLDERLFRTMAGGASTALRGRIAAIPAAQRRPATRRRDGRAARLADRFARPWRLGMAAAAASLVLGIAVGRSDLIPLDDSETAYDVATLSYDATTLMETLP